MTDSTIGPVMHGQVGFPGFDHVAGSDPVHCDICRYDLASQPDDAPRPLTEEERLADWMMFHLPEYNRWMMTGWRDTMRDEAVVLARQMLDAARAPRSDHKHTLHDGPHPWRQCECEWTAQTVATPVSPSPDVERCYCKAHRTKGHPVDRETPHA